MVLRGPWLDRPGSIRGQTMRKVLFLSLALVLSAFVVPLFAANPGSAASYTIKVTSPATGAQVSSLGVQMVVQVGGGFILDQQNYGGTNITDHGHVHYFVDGVYKGATWLTEFVFTGLTPGAHTLKAELHYNDHGLVVPIVADSIQVIAVTAPTSIVQGQDLTLTWTVAGFVMDAGAFGGTPEAGRGHVHVFEVVNGAAVYKGATAGSSWTFSGLSVGTHTFKVELFNNDHTALPTEYSSTKTVSVTASTAPPTVAGGIDPTVFYGSLIVLIIVIAALAAMLVRKGRGGMPAEPKQP